MNIPNNIKGYHVGEKDKCKKFYETQNLIVSKDKNFLGEGMYFWDNDSSARFWADVLKRQNTDIELAKLICNINIDAMLDLTDENVIILVTRLWDSYAKKTKHNLSYNSKEKPPLGYVLDLLPAFEKLYVRKGSLRYKDELKYFEIFDRKISSCQFSVYNRVIYCVKSRDVVLSRNIKEV